MRCLRYVCAAVLAALAQSSFVSTPHAQDASASVVISQIYGAGGNSGAVINADFIELYNRGSVPVSLKGWSLQYASATGTGLFGASGFTALPDVTLGPGRYFLVREASGSVGAPLPAPFYSFGSPIVMGAENGKVALVRTSQPLGCNGSTTPCTPAQQANIIDLVGYGTANFYEGSGAAPSASTTDAVVRRAGGLTDTNDNATDFVRGAPAPRNTGNVLALSLNDVTIVEEDSGTSVATFTIGLNGNALTTVTFTAATLDGTATAGEDYVAEPGIQLTIVPGTRSVTLAVPIFGDAAVEADETFEVVLSNVVGAPVSDSRGTGTIVNDDPAEHPIHALQGPGGASPFVNTLVATTGIVTGLKSTGFFLQLPDEQADGDPATSEGVFVFTGSAPTVLLGDAAHVTGRLVEFRRTGDARPGTLTEIGGTVHVTPMSSGNVLPTAIDLASIPTNAPTREAQLERYESMLVQAQALAVVAPTNRFGEFYGVLPGTSRPFREPGIDVSDTLPIDAPGTVARFDGNQERVMVDSDEALTADGSRRPALPLATGASVGPVYGPLDYAFDEYRLSLDAVRAVTATAGMTPRPLPASPARELSVVSLNVLNFFPTSATAAAQAAFAARVERTATTIIDDLRTPDILGLIELGDINGLRLLRDRINARAGASYEAYLVESDDDTENDQDVGYLVNRARVEVTSDPYPIGRGETFTLCGVTDVLLDRPPFVLEARFDGVPITVILNHLRSLIDINSTAKFGPSTCTETVGSRVREKRRLGAEFLADAIESRKGENLIVMGDMNAFEVNDGYGDIIGTLEGTPADPNTVVEPSTDRWSYTMASLARLVPPAERYSYVHEGNAQVLDHILVNQAMGDRLTGFGFVRINADFPESDRLSDHDAAFARFGAIARLSTVTELPPVLVSGTSFSFVLNVTNAGPDPADDVVVSTTLPQGVAFASASEPEGWHCSAASNTVTCASDAPLAPGASARLVVHASSACDLKDGTTLAIGTIGSSPDDADASDNGSADSAIVSNPAPVISGATVNTPVLESMNHKMQDVRVTYSTSDNCGTPTVTLTVSSNEPINGTGDGDMAPDWEVVNSNLVRLRAERAGTGKGRVYTITITASDSGGHSSRQAVTVTVPHD